MKAYIVFAFTLINTWHSAAATDDYDRLLIETMKKECSLCAKVVIDIQTEYKTRCNLERSATYVYKKDPAYMEILAMATLDEIDGVLYKKAVRDMICPSEFVN